MLQQLAQKGALASVLVSGSEGERAVALGTLHSLAERNGRFSLQPRLARVCA